MATESSGGIPPGDNGGNGNYTGENIKILEGLEAVRLRPAMYIGSTGEMGLHHLVYEVVDNSVDEALAGYCKKIEVVIHVDNSITVVDDGRGIPVDMMALPNGQMMPAVQVVLTKLHAGGKFDSSTYKVSGGLHGVGVSCVNALSQEFNVEIWRDGHTWEMDFSCGLPASELRQAGTSKRRGTKIHFLPDKSIFTTTEFNYDTLAQRLREMAFLNKGLEITLTDERTADTKTGEAAPHRVQLRGRHRGVRQAPQPRQAGAAREAHRDGSFARRCRDRHRAAIQRQLLRDGFQLRQQHQYGGRRLASFRFPHLRSPAPSTPSASRWASSRT